MKTYKVHLIRHGLTQGNLDGRYVGARTDLPLCPEGVARLRRLQEDYDYPAADKLYVAPHLRCRQTAHLLYPGVAEQEVMEELGELDFGRFEGKTLEELKGDPDFEKFAAGSPDALIPDGEEIEEFAARCTLGIRTVIEDMMKGGVESAAVVVPGGVIMGLLAAFGYPRKRQLEWHCDDGCGYTLLVTPQLWQAAQAFEVIGIMPHGAQTPTPLSGR
ncbi:histidine phosphatase family protein [Bittarella massiliensis (ex Durand et al. 2017)]|uniref:histidine phosphatase family protein n=1 Tax=Bittarella massiliensis (ex Durand et al. 2017) TaxID=1720313 RepID=UPI00073F5EA8|nr:histidine phosphatase family protein [Bittarella massiliensis (ex Durand et al. 2017)]